MLRLAFALILSLLASPVYAGVDPGTNTNAPDPRSATPHSSATAMSDRVVANVQVGDHAPDFSLPSADGSPYRLKQSRGRWTALFFTDRREDLDRIAGLAVTLDSLQFNTVVVLNEKVPTLTRWRAGAHSTLTALADERGEIASVYGLWDNLGSATRHGLYVLDPDGVVRLELLGQKVNAPSLRGLVQTAVEGL